MKHLKVALSDSVQSKIKSIAGRICVGVFETDFTDVGAVVIDDGELDLVNNNQISSFGIPVIVLRLDASKDISLYGKSYYVHYRALIYEYRRLYIRDRESCSKL